MFMAGKKKIQQGCIKLLKIDSKYFYIVTNLFQINAVKLIKES